VSKRLEAIVKKVDKTKKYTVKEAVHLVKEISSAKFDESVELHVRLGIDPKQTDQHIRGTVVLPHGTGKSKRVAVVAKGEKMKEAENAGADFVGAADLIEKIQKGWMDFDVLVATPDIMKDLSRLGKLLGPRGLMPNPKVGTVTFDISRTVQELKKGRIEFKNDAFGIVHAAVGKVSFSEEQLAENTQALISSLSAARPSGTKGVYIRSITVASTMGPGVPMKTDVEESE